MGLFGNIKSKPKPDPDKEFVLNYIAGRDGLGSIKGDSVVINKTGLTVTLGGCKVEENEGRFAAYLFFRIDRADFDEPVFEPQTSLGNSRKKALTTAAEQFVTVLMSMVLSIGMKLEKHPDLQSLSGLTFKELGCNMPEEYRNEIY